MNIGNVTIDYTELETSKFGKDVSDFLSTEEGVEAFESLFDIVPNRYSKVSVVLDTSVPIAQSGVLGSTIYVKVNPEAEMNHKFNGAATLYHEILHKSDIVSDTGALRAKSYIEKHPEVFNEIVELVGHKNALAALNYAFEEVIVQTWTNELRKTFDLGPVRVISTPEQALKSFLAGVLGLDPTVAENINFDEPFASTAADYTSLTVNRPGLKLSDDLSIVEAVFEVASYDTALANGHSLRPDGFVDYWEDANGNIDKTLEGSASTADLLDEYGRINEHGTAGLSFGGHLRALGDLIGLDGKLGLDGTFSRDREGKDGVSGGGGLLGDRDGDGIPNGLDFDDGVGPFDKGKVSDSGSDGGKGSGGGSTGGYGGANGNPGDSGGSDSQPILLDLNGNGIEITALAESTVFMVGEDGLDHKIAWAAVGDGVLFYDPDNTGDITELRQYVFTEWDPTASSDIEALANVFDSNGDGVFDANDAEWANFKVMVTNADGSQSAVTLASLGIVSIDLDVDATHIELPDGSVITGQTTFTYTDGSTGLVGDVTLVADSAGYDVEEVVSTDASANRVVEQTGYAADGSIAFIRAC